MSDNIKYISAEAFEKDVLQCERAVVDFYSSECPPCDALAVKYEPLSELYGKEIKFFKIFRQENRQLAELLGVKSSPTVLFYDKGKMTGEMLNGAIKRKDIIRHLDAMLPELVVKKLHSEMKPLITECDLLILGGGPAGLTAAIYGAQALLHTILVDSGMPGGQVSTTHQVSNYPGFLDPQPGFMLMHYMSEQAKKAGTEYRVSVDVTSIDLIKKEIVIDELETIRAKKIIIATGSTPNPLNIPGEKEYKGKGISYCATCDAKFYEGKHVVVIGGGDSAIEESMFIARFASNITLVHRGATFRANKVAQEKIFAEPKIKFVMEHSPREFKKNSDGSMTVFVEDLKLKELKEITADGVFIFTGMRPNLNQMDGQLALDNWGYAKVDQFMHTDIPDVFAAGDIASKPYRQITVAVADGTIAAITAAKELS
jgi:thioredoxin reductase (NADPH)